MPSYSVSLNAVVSPTGGSIARLDAVCAAGPATNMVVVANAANLAVAGGRFRGVALEAASGNQAIQIVDFGTVDLLTTVLSGTGEYVSVNATGQLVRTTAVTAATIGTLENGTVHVNVALGIAGATGNATAIQGVAVSSASASRGVILAGDGTFLRAKSWVPDLRDYFLTYGGADDAVTDCGAALRAAIADRNGQDLTIRPPTTGYLFVVTNEPFKVYDDTGSGFVRNLHIYGAAGRHNNRDCFFFRNTTPSGLLANITDYDNGGSGLFTQTIDLGAGSSAITTATADKWIGQWLKVWGAANDAHNGEFIIVAVPSDGVVRVSNQNTGAAGTDTNDGALHWRVLRPMMDIRSRNFVMSGVTIEPERSAGSRIDCFFEFNFAPGANAVQVIRQKLQNILITTNNPAAYRIIDGMWIARNVAPTSASNYLLTQNQTSLGLGDTNWKNGRGDIQEKAPYQVDTLRVFDTSIERYERFGAAVFSRTGQAKELMFECGGFAGRTAVGVPRTRLSGGVWTPDGGPHFDLLHNSYAGCETIAVYGGVSSAAKRIIGGYGEGIGRIFMDNHNDQCQLTVVENLVTTGTNGHPSGEIVEALGIGPYKFDGVTYGAADSLPTHFKVNGFHTAARGNQKLTLANCTIASNTSNTNGIRGRRTSTIAGPYVFAGTETLTISVNGAAAQTVTFSQANFNTANSATGTVDLNEVRAWEVGRLIEYYLTGGSAWGDADDKYVHIETDTGGVGGSIRITGGTANTQLGFNTGASTGIAASALETETGGYVQTRQGDGANYNIDLVISNSMARLNASNNRVSTFPENYRRRFTHNTATGKFSQVVMGTVTLGAAAGTTVNSNAVTADCVITWEPTNAAASVLLRTLGLYESARVAGTSFTLTTDTGGAAAGTETFRWKIEEAA